MRPLLFAPIILFAAVCCFAQQSQQTTGSVEPRGRMRPIRQAEEFQGIDAGAKINAAIQSLPAEGGEVDARQFIGQQTIGSTIVVDRPVRLLLGRGTYTGSTDPMVDVRSWCLITGVGAATSGGRDGATGTVLQTTGSNRAISIAGLPTRGSYVGDLAINNTGSGTVGIDVQGHASEIRLERITIYPLRMFSVAAIRLGNTSEHIVDVLLRDVVARGNAVGLDAEWISGHLVLSHSRFIGNSNGDVRLGTPTTTVVSFHAYGSTFETALRTEASVVITRAVNASFSDCYFENSNTAYAVDIPANAALAQSISFRGCYFQGNGSPAAPAAINAATPRAMLSVTDCFFGGYAPGGAVVRNVPGANITLRTNDVSFTDAQLVTTPAGVTLEGNRINGTITAPATLGHSVRLASTAAAGRCDESLRGTMAYFESSDGSDQLKVCLKDRNGIYAWRDLPVH